MAPESCDFDKQEAEVLKHASSPSNPPSLPSATSPLLLPSFPSSSASPLSPSSQQEKTTGNLLVSEKLAEESQPPVRFGNRCSSCRKRVGLTGFRCRCGELFCMWHRHSDTHDCTFDYKSAGKEEISKANPVIRAAKIIKI
ncbi:hypothetical protein HPP92_012375 [Vanilla planifolia]|uniref:AN1-type domain-containing protein n=1 Tax=Vanilla planifolia TaxID=51239 RepID=A0A835UZL3_VANPL|nr:hypothetical protein HPP92_012787 [Vanilla planifolia]KAG0477656.1 hypothetical protein HPP92_012375 [Vanilla planifolia]